MCKNYNISLKSTWRCRAMLFRQYDDILDLKQFMEYLNVGRTTAYKLLKSGEINVFRIGKVYKIPRKSVDEFIEKKRHKK